MTGTNNFGHKTSRWKLEGHIIFIDSWGSCPFVISAGGKSYRFEDSDQFGPSLITLRGDIAANPWPAERSPFWRAHRIWRLQGRRVLEDGISCVWDEPKPQVVQNIGGKHYKVVENGEEDGSTIVLETYPKSSSEI